MATDPETLYRELGRLVETMPDLHAAPLPPETQRWVGRAFALVQEVGNLADAAMFSVASQSLGTSRSLQGANQVRAIIYRALAVAERRAPAGAAGAFIPVGNNFDAFAALAKILQTAVRDVLIVDPYMDEAALTEFGLAVPEGVSLRLMADRATVKGTLQPAGAKWVQQYGPKRPLLVRLAPPKSLHDRAIFIDGSGAWTLTQSLKDFAKRSPAEIVRADDTAALKISAYEAIWAGADVLI